MVRLPPQRKFHLGASGPPAGIVVSIRVFFPLSTEARFPAAEITASVGVTFGFEMYLSLWNTVSENLVARVFNIQKVHAR